MIYEVTLLDGTLKQIVADEWCTDGRFYINKGIVVVGYVNPGQVMHIVALHDTVQQSNNRAIQGEEGTTVCIARYGNCGCPSCLPDWAKDQLERGKQSNNSAAQKDSQ